MPQARNLSPSFAVVNVDLDLHTTHDSSSMLKRSSNGRETQNPSIRMRARLLENGILCAQQRLVRLIGGEVLQDRNTLYGALNLHRTVHTLSDIETFADPSTHLCAKWLVVVFVSQRMDGASSECAAL